MTIAELETREKVPGYDLVGSYTAGVPRYKVRLKVQAQAKQTLPAVAMFALKLIELGINTEAKISEALALDTEIVRSALKQLDLEQLVTRKIDLAGRSELVFSTTDKGKLALSNALSASFVSLFDIQIDGLTGEIIPLYNQEALYEGPDLKKEDVLLLHAAPNVRPSVESLNEDLPHLIAAFDQQLTDVENEARLVEVLEVVKCWLVYKIVNVLVFQNPQNRQVSLRVFEGFEPVPVYDKKLTQRERDGGRVIPDGMLIAAGDVEPLPTVLVKLEPELEKLEKEHHQIESIEAEKEELARIVGDPTTPPHVVTSRTKKIQELELELQQIKEVQQQRGHTRYVKGSEHFDILKDSLSTATTRLIVISPWVNRKVVDEEVIGLMKKAIRRGVWIAIGYGMPPRPGQTADNYIDDWVKKQFANISRHDEQHRFNVEYLGNTHEKVLVCDDRYCVVGSHNWLSYRGDQGFRRERGLYHEDPVIIKDVSQDAIQVFKSLPADFPK